jgi:hypothetical protein
MEPISGTKGVAKGTGGGWVGVSVFPSPGGYQVLWKAGLSKTRAEVGVSEQEGGCLVFSCDEALVLDHPPLFAIAYHYRQEAIQRSQTIH